MTCCLVRKAFLVYVDLDPAPGVFHTPYSAYQSIQGIFEHNVRQYNPSVIFLRENRENGKRRICFVTYVNLDPTPGELFYSKESAQNSLNNMLQQRIPHYNPMVSLAPAEIQPEAMIPPAGVYPRIPLNGLQPINIEGNNQA